jgi:hypothetical protein
MKSKQLANVLLKILGLSMCLYAIPGVFSEITIAFTPLWFSNEGSSNLHDTFIRQALVNAVSFAAREVIEIGIGIFVIVKSRKISEFLFKNEAE